MIVPLMIINNSKSNRICNKIVFISIIEKKSADLYFINAIKLM